MWNLTGKLQSVVSDYVLTVIEHTEIVEIKLRDIILHLHVNVVTTLLINNIVFVVNVVDCTPRHRVTCQPVIDISKSSLKKSTYTHVHSSHVIQY